MKNRSLLIFIPLVLVPLLWFKNGLLIAGGDMSVFLNPDIHWRRLFLWSDYLNGGMAVSNIGAFFPFLLLFKLEKLAGISLVSAQKIWFIFSYLLAMFSTSYLYSTITQKKSSLGLLFACLFYLFNIYTLVISPFTFQYWLVYAAVPLTLALFVRGLNERKNSIKYLILTALSSLLYSGTNPALFLASFIPLIAYLLFFLFLKKGIVRSKKSIILSGMAIVFIIVVNLWALYPVFNVMANYFGEVKQSSLRDVSFSGSTHIFQSMRLMGQWAWPEHHLYQSYNNNLFIGLSYLIPLAIIGFIFINVAELDVLFFLILAIIGIFLSKGENVPFGFIYKYFSKIAGSFAFREPFSKFTFITTLSYAILLGVFVDNVMARLVNKNNKLIGKLVLFAIFTIVIINSWPVFTSNYISPGTGSVKSLHVKVPDYWQDSAEWLASDKDDFSLLELPEDNGYGMHFKWDYGYTGINPSIFLLNKPLWSHTLLENSNADVLVELAYKALYSKESDKLGLLLGLMNVKYLHLRKDLDWESLYTASPDEVERCLNYQKDIKLVKTIGQEYFYENTKVLPLVYGTSEVKILHGLPPDHSSMGFLEQLGALELPAIIFKGQIAGNPIVNINYRGYKLPVVKYKKINPCKYIVDVSAVEPFYLVFSQSFHPLWKAYIRGSEVKNHFIVNGYANGYFIDTVGKFGMVIRFIPQRLENLLIIVSAAAVIFSLIYLLFHLRYAKKRNK